VKAKIASKKFEAFVKFTKQDYSTNWHHAALMGKIQAFAEGKIKKLLVFMPPQHGKSELTSRRLPAYLLGINPDAKIVGASYSGDLSKSFNREVQRIIDSKEYASVFPKTRLSGQNVATSAKGAFLRNANIFEVVGAKGFYKSVGVGGSLTGTPVDIGIIDDPIKGPQQANSLTYRAGLWEWYTQVFLSRLHNDSQILITQTRWHENDLAGRILKEAAKSGGNDWEVVSFPAILENESQRTKGDPREIGEALWPNRHSLERLEEAKKLNPRGFLSLYQQDPRPHEGGLVYPKWASISKKDYDALKAPIIYGLDFGYSNSPAALIEIKIIKQNIYLKQLIYETKLDADPLGAKVRALVKTRSSLIIADSADPLLISHLRKKFGLNVKPAQKGKDSIPYGISLINNYNIFVEESSKDLQKELSLYRYKEDADGNPLDEPIKEHDHGLDAARYAVIHKVKKGDTNFLAYG
jgi:hypothetical protein